MQQSILLGPIHFEQEALEPFGVHLHHNDGGVLDINAVMATHGMRSRVTEIVRDHLLVILDKATVKNDRRGTINREEMYIRDIGMPRPKDNGEDPIGILTSQEATPEKIGFVTRLAFAERLLEHGPTLEELRINTEKEFPNCPLMEKLKNLVFRLRCNPIEVPLLELSLLLRYLQKESFYHQLRSVHWTLSQQIDPIIGELQWLIEFLIRRRQKLWGIPQQQAPGKNIYRECFDTLRSIIQDTLGKLQDKIYIHTWKGNEVILTANQITTRGDSVLNFPIRRTGQRDLNPFFDNHVAA